MGFPQNYYDWKYEKRKRDEEQEVAYRLLSNLDYVLRELNWNYLSKLFLKNEYISDVKYGIKRADWVISDLNNQLQYSSKENKISFLAEAIKIKQKMEKC